MTMEVTQAPVRWPESPSNGWWRAYRTRLPEGYFELIAAEADASRILHFQPIVMPGLLQTSEYAHAITPTTSLKALTADDVATLVDVRMHRQREVLDGSRRTEMVFLLDETLLRRPVGAPSTMRRQLDHLLQVIDHPAITLVVIPFHGPPHPGMLGAFMLMQYADAGIGDVISFEGQLGNVVVRDRPDLTAAYGRLAERLAAAGWRGREAAQTIRRVRDDIV